MAAAVISLDDAWKTSPFIVPHYSFSFHFPAHLIPHFFLTSFLPFLTFTFSCILIGLIVVFFRPESIIHTQGKLNRSPSDLDFNAFIFISHTHFFKVCKYSIYNIDKFFFSQQNKYWKSEEARNESVDM